MGTDCQKVLGHCVVILHEKLGWGLVKVWWVGLPKFIDRAKIGLPMVSLALIPSLSRPGFLGNNFPEKTVVLISPRITVS